MSDTQDAIRRAQERAQAEAGYPRWSPKEPGDHVAGIIVAIDDAEGEYGPFKVAVIERDDSVRITVAFVGHVLKGKFDEEAVAVGKALSVTFLGSRTSQAGKDYQAYAVGCVEV